MTPDLYFSERRALQRAKDGEGMDAKQTVEVLERLRRHREDAKDARRGCLCCWDGLEIAARQTTNPQLRSDARFDLGLAQEPDAPTPTPIKNWQTLQTGSRWAVTKQSVPADPPAPGSRRLI